MCCPPINQYSGTLINDLIESADKLRQCEASVGGGENPPQCPKQATNGRMCDEHYEE
jgi:hypothetical protein